MTINVSIDFEGDSLYEIKTLSESFIKELKKVDKKLKENYEDVIYICINNAIRNCDKSK